jgi:hypothetical protein
VKAIDSERIEALAGRLELTPRQVLAIAARAVELNRPLGAIWLGKEIARVRLASEAAEAAADLALLGYASYALDDVDRALALVWSDTHRQGL